MNRHKIIGVITGDLIKSSSLNETQKEELKVRLENFTGNCNDVILPLQFYRGDSFQLMCTKEKAAWLAIFIQAIIISTAETMARISIGIGTISKLHPKDVLQSEGEAFLLSGHQLDEMKSQGRILKIVVNHPEIQPSLDITLLLTETIIADWKPGQASVLSMIPQAETQRDIAEKLNISQAAVSKTLKSSKWEAIRQYLAWYENFIKKAEHE